MTGQENKRPNELIEHAPVTLRRFRAEDADALFGAVIESLDELRPWMPWAADYSRASAEEYLAGSVKDWDEGTAYNYAIVTGDGPGRQHRPDDQVRPRRSRDRLLGAQRVHRPRVWPRRRPRPWSGRRSACPAWTGWRSCTTS